MEPGRQGLSQGQGLSRRGKVQPRSQLGPSQPHSFLGPRTHMEIHRPMKGKKSDSARGFFDPQRLVILSGGFVKNALLSGFLSVRSDFESALGLFWLFLTKSEMLEVNTDPPGS